MKFLYERCELIPIFFLDGRILHDQPVYNIIELRLVSGIVLLKLQVVMGVFLVEPLHFGVHLRHAVEGKQFLVPLTLQVRAPSFGK